MLVKNELEAQIADAVCAVKEKTPLAGSITNFVTVDFVANAQLAAGGSAAMVYMPDEVQDLVKIGSSLYINTGTFLPGRAEAVITGVCTADELGKPWVLDPVASGLGTGKARVLAEMKEQAPAIIRCNASEAIALAHAWGLDKETEAITVKGVDSTDTVETAQQAAIALAQFTGGAVAVSGPVDLITDGMQIVTCAGGSPLMEKVTGFGCALGGVMAVYAAVTSPFIAALAGSFAFKLAANKAMETKPAGPASFKMAFIDELYALKPEEIAAYPFEIIEVQA